MSERILSSANPIAVAARAGTVSLHAALHHCACFRLCSEKDARSFHLRVPTVSSRKSPWYSYLQWVYKEERVPLPVNLSTFEFFYLSLLPVEWRCQADQSVLPMCDEETCSQWLIPELPSARQLEDHAKQWGVRSYQWHRSRFPRLMWNQTLRFIPRAPSESFYRRHPLVEVTRHSKLFSGWYDWCAQGSSIRADEWVGNRTLGAAEGVEYGCWFTPSVGTGVFLPTRNMLYLVDRLEVERRLPEVMRFPLVHQNTTFETRAEQYVTIHHKDCLYATATRERKFDTLLIERNPEGAPHFVVASTGCMQQAAPLPTGCAPADVGLRTGWKGERPCACSGETANDGEGLSTVLNCLNS